MVISKRMPGLAAVLVVLILLCHFPALMVAQEAPTEEPSQAPSTEPIEELNNEPTSSPSAFFPTPSGAPSISGSQPTSSPSAFFPTPSGAPNVNGSQPTSSPSAFFPTPSGAPSISGSQPTSSPSAFFPTPSGAPSISGSQPTSSPSAFFPTPSGPPNINGSQPTSFPSAFFPTPSGPPNINGSQPTMFPSTTFSDPPSVQASTKQPTLAFANTTSNSSNNNNSPNLVFTGVLELNRSAICQFKLNTSENVRLWCSALPSTANLESISQIRIGSGTAFNKSVDPGSITVGNLDPLTKYVMYLYGEKANGEGMSIESVRNTGIIFNTKCCRDVHFERPPSVIDPRDTTVSSRRFDFALSNLPTGDIVLTAAVLDSSLKRTSITPIPSSFTFLSNSSVSTGSFLLPNTVPGTFTVTFGLSTLAATSLASDYIVSPAYVTILAADAPILPPVMTQAVFSDSGGSVIIAFSVATNQAGIVAPSWPCSLLYSFRRDANTTCNWVNASATRVLFPPDDGSLLLPGDSLSLKPFTNLTAACLPRSVCTSASEQSLIVTTPSSTVIPQVIFNVPANASNCDDLTIDVSSSSGSGGRSWASVIWQFSASPESAFYSNITALLPLSTLLLAKPIVIRKALLNLEGTFTFTLELVNFLGKSAFNSATVRLVEGIAIPSINIPGSDALSAKAGDSVFISSVSVPSACDTSKQLTLSWAVFSNRILQSSIVTTSRDPSVFRALPYTFLPNTVYAIVATATSRGGYSSSARVTLTVASGAVVARIRGGASITAAIDTSISLDASGSYDENSLTSTLTYNWGCLVVSEANFGSDCSSVITTNTQAVLVLAPFALTGSVSYSFTVVASAADGRSARASVVVATGLAGSPKVDISIPTKLRFNVEDKLVLSGNVASTFSTVSYWNVSSAPPIDLAAASLTQIQRSFDPYGATGISFPLAISAYSLSAGVTYTFTLTAFVRGQVSLQSSASFQVTINSPPTSGVLTVTPSSGEALTTSFGFGASGWIDDSTDYPILYDFAYSTPDGKLLTLSSKSISSFTSSTLPPGLAANAYSLDVYSGVYDNFGASTSVQGTVAVNPVSVNTDIGGVLSAALSDSSNAGQTTNTVNVVASTFESQDCANAPDCAALSRNECSSQTPPNKCGDCIDSFASASASGECFAIQDANTLLPLGAACTGGQECVSLTCASGVCVALSKECPDPACSGNGACIFQDISGNTVEACSSLDVYCSAVCDCNDGFGGSDCSLSPAARIARDGSRTLMCTALLTTIAIQEPSAKLLDSLASSMLLIYNPFEVESIVGTAACGDLFTAIASLAADGYLVGAAPSTVRILTAILSNFVVSISKSSRSATSTTSRSVRSLQDAATFATASVTGAVGDIINGVLQDISEGQDAIEVSSNNFILKVQNLIAVDLQNAALTPPVGSSKPGSVVPTIVLPTSGLGACGNSNGYSKLSVSQWVNNPYQNSSAVKTPVLRFTSSLNGESSTLLTLSQIAAADSIDETFLIVLPFSDPSTYNATSGLFVNNTIPQCVIRRGSQYIDARCNVTSYSATNVTFVCASVASLCSSDGLTSSLQAVSSVTSQAAEYGSFYQRVGKEFSSVLLRKPVAPSPIVAAVVGAMMGFIVLGVIIFLRWDKLDRTKVRAIVGGSIKEKVPPVLRRDSSTNMMFAEAGMPPAKRKSLLTSINDNIVVRYFRVLKAEHKLFFPLFGMSISETRTIRFVAFALGMLLDMFWDTVIFGVLYPSDSTCETYQTADSCTADQRYGGGDLCEWDGSGCSLAAPSNSIVFIIVLSILVSTLTIPCELVFDYLMFEVNVKRPRLERIGLSSNYWLGEPIVDSTLVELEEELNNEDRVAVEIQTAKKVVSQYATLHSSGTVAKNIYIERWMDKHGLFCSSHGELHVKYFSKLYRSGDVDFRVREALEDTKSLSLVIQASVSVEDTSKDTTANSNLLFRYLVFEYLKGKGQNAFRSAYLKLPPNVQEFIAPLPWILSWTFVCLSIGFILYWILQWGSVNGDRVVEAWGINYLLSFFYSVMVVECIKVFVFKVLYLDLVSPRVTDIYDCIHEQGIKDDFTTSLVQLMSPACVAASFSQNDYLASAQILRKFDDRKSAAILETEGVIATICKKSNTHAPAPLVQMEPDYETVDAPGVFWISSTPTEGRSRPTSVKTIGLPEGEGLASSSSRPASSVPDFDLDGAYDV